MNSPTFKDVECAVVDAVNSRFAIGDYLVTVNCSDSDATLTITDTKSEKRVSRIIPFYKLIASTFPQDTVRQMIWKMRSELMDARQRVG